MIKTKSLIIGCVASLLMGCAQSTTVQQDQATTPENDPLSNFILYGHLYLPMTVDSVHKANMVFDTGASKQLVMDTQYLKEEKWKLTDLIQASAKGAAGESLVDVSFESHYVENEDIQAEYSYMILEDLRSILGKWQDGLFCSSDFDTRPYMINYEHRYLRPIDEVPDSVKETYECLPLEIEGSHYMVKAKIWFDGKCIEGLYNIDTGSGGCIDMTAETVAKYHLEDYKGETEVWHGLQMGIGDQTISTGMYVEGDSLQMGPFMIKKLDLGLNPNGKGAFGKSVYVGNIGNQIWRNYNLVFDVPHKKLYMQKHKEYEKPKKGLGFAWINRTDINRGWIVRIIYENGRAEKAGLQLGDIIREVDGKKVEDFTWEEERHFKPEHMTLVIERDGKRKNIVL